MQFVPLSTFVDTSFWSEVNRRKLEEWRLDESANPVGATYSIYDAVGTSSRLSFSTESFTDGTPVRGEIVVSNILDNFLKMDRKAAAEEKGRAIWSSIESGAWLADPASVNTFLFTAFADLKKFRYHYWQLVPALALPDIALVSPAEEVSESLSRELIAHLESTSLPVFLLPDGGPPTPLTALPTIQGSFAVVVADACTTPGVAGWLTRNVVTAFWKTRPNDVTMRLLSLRGGQASWTFSIGRPESVEDMPRVVGWERDEKDGMRPRTVDLSRQFHPHKLMEQAVDLNVSLIKWRLVPGLDTKRFSQLKCLLLGAGTLGCNVARALLGWGVRTITFVDNGTVSYSNPVRQSLSEFEDAQKGRGKAEVAAASLRRIFPSLDTRAVDLTIPMPGHTVDANQEQSIHAAVDSLTQLVDEHDVVFLLLDSREARWLPTVLCASRGKLCFSVALGFDNFVVIRHGVVEEGAAPVTPPAEVPMRGLVPADALGCYFCSDVTAPGNSTTDRTLDQQCTVARPGLSQIASGTAVELLASVLQHPDPLRTPAWCGEPSGDETAGVLGAAPHQVRGYVFRFSQMTPCVRRFHQCIACGPAVREAMRERGSSLVVDACNRPSSLEELSGLDALQASTDDIQIDMSDDGSDDF